MPVFTEGRGVPFPRWQIEGDPSLMLMQIDAPADAKHPDVQRYAQMLSEALFKQGSREPNWWKYPRGTRRFNKLYGTKFSSKVPRGVVTGMPRRGVQPRRTHATKRDSGSGVPSALPRYEQGSNVIIDHSDIPRDDLRIAKGNASHDPDGQVFPWRPLYPLIGATVYYDGMLWIVSGKERGPGSDQLTSGVKLVGQGHDDTAIVTRGELRPVTWTQHDEDWLGRD